MKWKSILAAMLVGAIGLVGSVSPAYAADGDAKMVLVDRGTNGAGSTVILTCTSANSPCSTALTAGHYYDFTLTEESWDPVYEIDITAYKDDLSTNLAAEWPTADRTHDELWEEPTCEASDFTYTSSSVWWSNDGYCGNGNNGIYYVLLKGKATSSTDGSMSGSLRKGTSGTLKFVTINYGTN